MTSTTRAQIDAVSPLYQELEKAVHHLGHIVNSTTEATESRSSNSRSMSEADLDNLMLQLQAEEQHLLREYTALSDTLETKASAPTSSELGLEHIRLQAQVASLEQELTELAQHFAQVELDLEVAMMEAELDPTEPDHALQQRALDRLPSARPHVATSKLVVQCRTTNSQDSSALRLACAARNRSRATTSFRQEVACVRGSHGNCMME
jgi:hypothetical protein